MRKRLFVALTVAVLTLGSGVGLVLAVPPDDPATCAVSVTVDDIMEWNSDFTAISLSNITAQSTVVEGSGTCTLFTNGDVSMSADITAAAQLSEVGGDTLVTEYQLTDDGDGVTTTGGTDQVTWTAYDTFLSTPYAITHADEDGAVVITLHAQASNDTGNVADAGAYTATQTLTASWAS